MFLLQWFFLMVLCLPLAVSFVVALVVVGCGWCCCCLCCSPFLFWFLLLFLLVFLGSFVFILDVVSNHSSFAFFLAIVVTLCATASAAARTEQSRVAREVAVRLTFPLGVPARVQDFLAFLAFEACPVPVFAQRSFSFGEVDFLCAGWTLRHAYFTTSDEKKIPGRMETFCFPLSQLFFFS